VILLLVADEIEDVSPTSCNRLGEFRLTRIAPLDAGDKTIEIHMIGNGHDSLLFQRAISSVSASAAARAPGKFMGSLAGFPSYAHQSAYDFRAFAIRHKNEAAAHKPDDAKRQNTQTSKRIVRHDDRFVMLDVDGESF